MSVQIIVPTALRTHVGDQRRLDGAGATVGEVLESTCAAYPALGQRLFAEGGSLNRFINVFLNDEDIRFLEELDTPVAAGDELALLPAVAGG